MLALAWLVEYAQGCGVVRVGAVGWSVMPNPKVW